MGDCAAKVNTAVIYASSALVFCFTTAKEPPSDDLGAQHKCQPRKGKTLNEKPTAWKHKELFQEDDLISIIIYDLVSSYLNVDGLRLSFRVILKSEKKKHNCLNMNVMFK